MKVNINWLKKYLPELQINDVESFRDRLDRRLTEVEAIEIKGTNLSGLITAEIVEAAPHPTKSNLQVCQVNIGGKETIEVVCGAPNAAVGLHTVYCMNGGSVVNHQSGEAMEITERKFDDVISNGMLCSPAELGLGTSHEGLIELPNNVPSGVRVDELFKDLVVEIQNKSIPHRPDCFSHRGIAKELSAIFKTKFQEVELNEDLKPTSDNILPLSVNVRAPIACKRFTAITVSGITVKPSPLWLQVQLAYAGIRPINNIVDITNYVMLDLGQPLHAFDYNKIQGGEIVVRKAHQGELVTTLDGKERKLDKEVTVVADPQAAQAIAGIMGGQSSEITAETKTIIIEAGNWEMYQTRNATRLLGLRSEAATRFEKGLSPAITLRAVAMAVQMIHDLSGGEIASELVDYYPEPLTEKIVEIETTSVKRLLGIDIDKDELVDLFERVDILVVNNNQLSAEVMSRDDVGAKLQLSIPLNRMDLKAPEDILEEVARLYGYERVVPTLPTRDSAPNPSNKRLGFIRKIKQTAAASGFDEIYSYAMVGEEMYAKVDSSTEELISIKNPISPELAFVRNQILPSILDKLAPNLNSGYEEFGLFEVDKVALKTKAANGLPNQVFKLAACYVSESEQTALAMIHDLITNLSRSIGLSLSVKQSEPTSHKFLHPGKTGEIVDGNGKVVGVLGVVTPKVAEQLDVKTEKSIVALELHGLETLIDEFVGSYNVKPFVALSDQPVVIRDLSFWDEDKRLSPVGAIVETIKHMQLPELTAVELVDIFVNKEGKRSFALRLHIQSATKTLTAEEINKILEDVTALVTKEYRVKLR